MNGTFAFPAMSSSMKTEYGGGALLGQQPQQTMFTKNVLMIGVPQPNRIQNLRQPQKKTYGGMEPRMAKQHGTGKGQH